VRPWTLAAWCALTIGIALGSWWAYYELGWGGFWFWDPVENASLVPWLIGTALLHSAVVVEKREALKSWTVLLAILTFAAALLGTFLVRSGVLSSVHSFASDPERGVFILALLVLAIGGSLTLYAVRAPALKGGGLFAPISREGALALNNLFLCTAAAIVLLGTLYPLILDALGGARVSVGPPFFTATFVPVMLPLLAAMPIGGMLAWKRGDLSGVLMRLKLAFAAAVILGLVVAARDTLAGLGLGLALWLILGALWDLAERVARGHSVPRASWGMAIAHAAMGIIVAGITASHAWQQERIGLMRPGESVELAGYTFRFAGAEQVPGPNYVAWRGSVIAMRGDRPIALMQPEKRSYPVERQTTTEAAIHTSWLADLYVVLGEPDGAGAWSVRIYYNPLVPWIWVGAIAAAFGGMVSLTDRRHRVGAPVRAVRATQPI
jgi:cytochrome c-type biogenesis protein CcmF